MCVEYKVYMLSPGYNVFVCQHQQTNCGSQTLMAIVFAGQAHAVVFVNVV
jgi:hypothetical protein